MKNSNLNIIKQQESFTIILNKILENNNKLQSYQTECSAKDPFLSDSQIECLKFKFFLNFKEKNEADNFLKNIFTKELKTPCINTAKIEQEESNWVLSGVIYDYQ